MKIKLRDRIKSAIRGFSVGDLDRLMDLSIYGYPTSTNINVNQDTALTYSAFFDGIRQISETIASLELLPYRTNGESKEVIKEHPLYYLFKYKVNPYMKAVVWKQAVEIHKIMWGNAYSFIERDRGNRVTGLYLFNPEKMRVETKAGYPIYYFRKKGKDIQYGYENILHLADVTLDGLTGVTVLKLAREGIGLGLAQEKFNAKFYGSGTHTRGILTHPAPLTKEAKERLKEQLMKDYAGINNVGKILVLDEGIKYESLNMPLEDAQFIESRTFQITDVARWLNMPPHKLKDHSNATYSNIEHSNISYYQDTIRPKLEKNESYFGCDLLNDQEKKNIICEYNFKSLLRTSLRERFEAFQIAKNNSVISVNEWRREEGMDRINEDWADKHTMPLNMTYAEDFDPNEKQEEPMVEEQPQDEPAQDEEPEEDQFIKFEKRYGKRKVNIIREKQKAVDEFRKVFFNVASKIVNSDIRNIRKDIDIPEQKTKKRQKTLLKDNIKKYYNDPLVIETLQSEFKNAYKPYSEIILDIIGKEIDINKDINKEFNNKVNEFSETAVNRYIGSSRSQLLNIIDNSENELEDLNMRLNEWGEKRPDKIAHRESIDGMGGLSNFIYFSFGFRVIWLAVGKSCPYCLLLDSRTISEGQYFINEGDKLSPDGKEPMEIKTNISHPQAHQGCDCLTLSV